MLNTFPQIHFYNVFYSIPDTAVNFHQLTLTINQQKIGVIGDNGVGKTTFLRLITQEIIPNSGNVRNTASLAYCPQNFTPSPEATIADVLDIKEKLLALTNIMQGKNDLADYEILNEEWDIKERITDLMAAFSLSGISLERQFNTLSGGQKTRLLLLKAMLSKADFILLDEPTNNLDANARHHLYQFINQSKQGLIIVSHDRYLLDQMEVIIELTGKGIHFFGGNYTHYREQKGLQSAAMLQQLNDAKKVVKKAEKSAQLSLEKLEQRRAKGRKEFRSGKIDKLSANSKRGRSERTQSRLAIQEDRIITQANQLISKVREKIEIKHIISTTLTSTAVAKCKIVLEIKDLYFKYPEVENFILENFSLQIMGQERIALLGDNGAGKTTLIKLILQKLQPCSGEIRWGIEYISYLDQHTAELHSELSVLENFRLQNPEVDLTHAHQALADFLFRNYDANKLAKYLSGGERIRAALACTLFSKHPPQLLILDEPTNHLDIHSIQAIESALTQFQGTMLVVSHDIKFMENIFISKVIDLSN